MDDLKSNGISMKSIEAGCVWQRKVSRKEALRIVQKAQKEGKGNHRTIKPKWQYRYLSIRTAISFFLA
jgi:hypothetical protein